MSSKSDTSSTGKVDYGVAGANERQILIQQNSVLSNTDSLQMTDNLNSPMLTTTLANSKNDMFMQEFLEAARDGNAERLGELIQLGNKGKNLSNDSIKFDINYRGKLVCSFNLNEMIILYKNIRISFLNNKLLYLLIR